jgi:hypothetical protein
MVKNTCAIPSLTALASLPTVGCCAWCMFVSS